MSLIDLCKHFTSQRAADQEGRKEDSGRGKDRSKSDGGVLENDFCLVPSNPNLPLPLHGVP